MPPMRSVEISLKHPRLRVDREKLEALIETLDLHAERFDGGCPEGELSLALVTDKAIAAIHDDFLDDPTPTDVITFEGQPEFGVAGEICVSADTAERYAAEHGRAFSEELSLYVIHGWLHLAGYDDLRPAKKRRMRAAEARAMKLLAAHAAIPAFALRR